MPEYSILNACPQGKLFHQTLPNPLKFYQIDSNRPGGKEIPSSRSSSHFVSPKGKNPNREVQRPNHRTTEIACLTKVEGPVTWKNLVRKLNSFKVVVKEDTLILNFRARAILWVLHYSECRFCLKLSTKMSKRQS